MKSLNSNTIEELRTRIAKGASMLNADTKNSWCVAVSAYVTAQGRTRSNLRKQDYITIFNMLAHAYKIQQTVAVHNAAATAFDYKTASFADRARHRAAQIRTAMSAAKEEALRSGKCVQIKLPKITWQ